MERKQAFERLKPACVELFQAVTTLSPTPTAKGKVTEALRNLLQSLRSVSANPDVFDAKLADFVFVPISHVLRASRDVPVSALELCLQCITILITTGWAGNLSTELTGQLLILLTFLANPSPAENGLQGTSEELQTAAFKSLAQLIDTVCKTPQGRSYLTEASNIPGLGKAVLLMADSLVEVPSPSVKAQALEALHALVAGIADLDALASFLPRIVSSLTKILTPSVTARPHFRLLVRGLELLAALLLRTLSDIHLNTFPSHATGPGPKEGDRVVRTVSWLAATAGQIKIALANVVRTRKHDRVEVRNALYDLCKDIVVSCRESLRDCVGMLTETMVSLAGQEDETKAIASDLKLLLSTDVSLAELLRESLHGWVMSLPRLMQSKDDNERRQIINNISFSLRLLNDHQVDLSLIDERLAANLRDSVAEVLKAPSGVGAVAEVPVITESALISGGPRTDSFEPLNLQVKGQDRITGELAKLIQDLGSADSALLIAQDLVDSVELGTDDMRLASFWLSVRLLQSITRQNPALDDFLDFGSPDAQTALLEQLYSVAMDKLTRTPAHSETRWQNQALSLEVVAMQAQRYGTEFRVELVDALYPVLHYLGDPNPGLRSHAMACLNIMAEACQYKSASDLVISNVDYIINAVGLKLNYHEISPQAPQVLLMMLKLCGPSILPYLDDLLGSIFSALERYHGYPKLVELLFAVLRGMAEEGVKAPQLMIEDTPERERRRPDLPSMADVIASIQKLKADALKKDEEHTQLPEAVPQKPWKELRSEDTTASEQQDASHEDKGETAVQTPDPPPPAPKLFGILLKISELTQHHLTSSSPALRTSLLSLLNTTIPALAKHENSFLPLINTLWPVLLPRLHDPEAYVVSNALDIMSMICLHAGDFMKSRTEGMWGQLKRLHAQSTQAHTTRPKSQRNDFTLRPSQRQDLVVRGPTHADSRLDTYQPEKYVDTPTRMIRESLIRLLSTVAKHVEIRDELFDEMLDMLTPFLERDDVRRALESRNPDAVWLRLFRLSQVQGKSRCAAGFNGPGYVPTGGNLESRFVKI
ncbi:ARM repeat-containing protein [Sporormia fimetaria CBS 119925]|uniref:ARM repeat-containing protein n=1 Tax=Sporormia fimetaria CBS 119925 TaxID=1340428 RepID=A0A6A6VMT2_9PLEO|nr:ARM repeat-containing protein [Sporormia fimetaria CBS 119925]